MFRTCIAAATLLVLPASTTARGVYARMLMDGAGRTTPTPVVIDRIRFFPAPGHERAMVGGKFTGSNVSPEEGFEPIAEVTSEPKPNEWSEITLANNQRSFRWLRYDAPAGSHGQVAEIEFYSGDRKLTGRGFGPTRFHIVPNSRGSSWYSAFDGNTATVFVTDADASDYAGFDLGAMATVAQPKLVPSPGTYRGAQQVTMESATPGAVVRYTLDGTLPGPGNGVVYEHPITLSHDATLVVIASKEGVAASIPIHGTYWIGDTRHRTVNTFHIGNSLTGQTTNFADYARTAGATHRYSAYLIGGALTVQLWNAKDSRAKDNWERAWGDATVPLDHLTLQPRDFNIDQEAASVVQFIDLVRKTSPNVQPWLYAEWVEEDRARPSDKGEVPSSQMTKVFPALTWQESMGAMLLYNEEVQRRVIAANHPGKRVRVLPTDLAVGWTRTLVDNGSFPGVPPGKESYYKLLFGDAVHFNATGSYLVDLTWYSAFYGESPEGKMLPVGTTLTPAQAKILQRLAWEVVKNYPDAGLYEEGTTPVAKPEFLPPPAPVRDVTPLTLASPTPGAWFRYTLDGTTPTPTNGYVYCGVISVRPGMKVKAVAYKSGMKPSGVAEGQY